MLGRQVIYDGNFQRKQEAGDCITAALSVAALTTAGAGTITAAMIAAGVIRRTGPTAGYTDTWPTAAQIAELAKSYGNMVDWSPGIGFMVRHINTVAYAATMAVPASSGISLSTAKYSTVTANAASQWRDYFVELVSEPVAASLATAAITNGSKKIVPAAELAYGSVAPGMSVYGTGIGASALVTHVVHGVSGISEVWVDTNSTADNAAASVTFTPTVVIHSIGAGDL